MDTYFLPQRPQDWHVSLSSAINISGEHSQPPQVDSIFLPINWAAPWLGSLTQNFRDSSYISSLDLLLPIINCLLIATPRVTYLHWALLSNPHPTPTPPYLSKTLQESFVVPITSAKCAEVLLPFSLPIIFNLQAPPALPSDKFILQPFIQQPSSKWASPLIPIIFLISHLEPCFCPVCWESKIYDQSNTYPNIPL